MFGAFGASVGSSADASTNVADTTTNETTITPTAFEGSDQVNAWGADATINYTQHNSDQTSFAGLLDSANKLFAGQMSFTNLMGKDVLSSSVKSQENAIKEVSKAYAVSKDKIDWNKSILFVALLGGAGIYFKMRKN